MLIAYILSFTVLLSLWKSLKVLSFISLCTSDISWNSFHGPRLILHSHYFSDYLNYGKCFTMFYGIWITFIVIIISVFLLTQCLFFSLSLPFSIFCSIYLLLSVLLLEITSFLCFIYLFFANCVSVKPKTLSITK